MNNYSHIVFNHIPKCGGSSLRYMFYESCLDNEYFARSPMYIPECTHGTMCLQENKEFITTIHHNTKIFFDHSYSYFFEQTFDLNIDNTFRIINIRNPIKRLISHMRFFDKISPEQCSYKILKNKIEDYGFVFINYLTLHQYGKYKLDLETKLNIAKEELEKYNFIFVLEKFKSYIEEFNITNPFLLKLEEKHINDSSNKNFKLPRKTLYNIKKLIEPEIILLKDFYPNIDEDIY